MIPIAVTRAVTQFFKLLCLAASLAFAVHLPATTRVAAQEAPQVTASDEFRSLLLESGFAERDFAVFDDWSGQLSDAQADLVARLLYRLDWIERSGGPAERSPPAISEGEVVASDMSRPQPGLLVQVEGRAVAASAVELPVAAQSILELKHLSRCDVQLANGEQIVVLSLRAPTAWAKRKPDSLNEPVTLRGVVLGSTKLTGVSCPLLLANHIEWRPESNVSEGVAWLVEHGFDAALLDEVRHGRGFARPHESREAEAFYECLAIIANVDPAELSQRVREGLPTVAERSKAVAARAAKRRKEVAAEWASGTSSQKKALQIEMETLRRRRALAAEVGERAERGLSSVLPMFLEPERNVGEFVLIEGTARRAVRIVVEDTSDDRNASSAGARAQGETASPLREYFELDVFTADSQNQPIICCVARLPDGFPNGEIIREPVRVAGVFFKKWAYAQRTDGDGATDRPSERAARPLVLAAAPEWLRPATTVSSNRRGLWGGVAFLGVVVVLWIALARISRRDQLARAGRARYDSRLDELAEP